jgi:lipoprotein-releasing system permease protein
LNAKSKTAFWFARRYLISRRNPHASFINWVSFAGLVLGVMILTVVVSIMNGFDRELKTRLLGAVPHAFLIPPDYDSTYPGPLDGVISVTKFFQGQAMLSRHGTANALRIYATDAAGINGLDLVAQRVVQGSITDLFESHRGGGIVLGEPLARSMGIEIGDPVVLVIATPITGGIRPRVERFQLRATFELGAQLDYSLAVVGLRDVEARGLASSGLFGWRLQYDDPLHVPEVSQKLESSLPSGWSLQTWRDMFGGLFRAVRLEKSLMFISLTLVVAIAAFNIVSGQVMLVNDKRGDTAMLTTMGAPKRLLVEVFLYQGFAVAVLGTAVGLIAGVLIALNASSVISVLEGLMGMNILYGTPYNGIPSDILLSDLAIIAGLSLGLCFLAVLRPALKAVDENPAQALHAA